MPLALLAIGSQIDSSKYEVVIIDGRIDEKPKAKIKEACKDALCFGVTVLTGKPIQDALHISEFVKSEYPSLKIIWGGWHPSMFGAEILEETNAVDVCVQGQGEETFLELIEHYEGHKDLSSISGICFRDKFDYIQKTGKRHLKDMNELEPSDYSLIEVEKYFKKKKQRQFDYISSTGCRFRCTFCADPFVYERGWTGVEPDRMGEEFSKWNAKYNFDDINFQDETFFTKRKRVNQIAEQLLDRNINSSWAATLRGDQGNRMSEQEFDLVKKSGLRRVLVGVESGSQEMMDWLKKDIKMEHIWNVAKRCADRDIAVIFPFIIGFPGESDESVRSSLNMAQKLNKMNLKNTTPIFYFKPYPGSKITQDVVSEGFQMPTSLADWAIFDYVDSAGPWVSPKKYKMVERFKFYNKMAGRKHKFYSVPLKWISEFRLNSDFLSFPFEKYMADLFVPQKELS